MNPKYPRIVPDRDRFRNWYLDEDVELTLSDGTVEVIEKGYRFDGPSIPWFIKWAFKIEKNDVIVALPHDYLIDRAPWSRYKRKFKDLEYKRFSEMPEYFTTSFRVKWFPRAVRLWGFLCRTMWGK